MDLEVSVGGGDETVGLGRCPGLSQRVKLRIGLCSKCDAAVPIPVRGSCDCNTRRMGSRMGRMGASSHVYTYYVGGGTTILVILLVVVPPTAAKASKIPLQPAGEADTMLDADPVPLPCGIVTVTPQLLDGLTMCPVE